MVIKSVYIIMCILVALITGQRDVRFQMLIDFTTLRSQVSGSTSWIVHMLYIESFLVLSCANLSMKKAQNQLLSLSICSPLIISQNRMCVWNTNKKTYGIVFSATIGPIIFQVRRSAHHFFYPMHSYSYKFFYHPCRSPISKHMSASHDKISSIR